MKVRELFESQSDKEIHAVIREWRKHYKTASYKKEPFGNYEITPNGIDHKAKHLTIYDFMLDENGELPIKFWRCNSLNIFLPDPNRLKSFKNFPEIISRQIKINPYTSAFDSAYDINIDSLEGIPRHIAGGSFNLLHFPKLSLHNVHKHIDFFERLSIPSSYKGPLLGILRIKDLRNTKNQLDSHSNTRTKAACEIINKHLNSGKDILDCQEDLIDAGLTEYAKL